MTKLDFINKFLSQPRNPKIIITIIIILGFFLYNFGYELGKAIYHLSN